MSDVIGFLGVVAAAVFVWAFSRHHALRARQMLHEERITAMQKGLEIPHQGVVGSLHRGNLRRAGFEL